MSTSERQHGTRAMYVAQDCRCFQCRVANADYASSVAARKRARAPWRIHYIAMTKEWLVRNQLTRETAFRTTSQVEAYEHREALNALWARELREQQSWKAAGSSGSSSRNREPPFPLPTATAACRFPRLPLLPAAAAAAPLWADEATVRAVRRHLRELRQAGIGFRQLAAAAGLSRTRLTEILHDTCYHADRPQKRWLKHETAQRILELLPERELVAPGAYVDARETWRLIDELLAAGLRRYEIAAALGQTGNPPALQIQRDRVRKSTEIEVRKLHDLAYRGSAKLRAVCRCPEWRR